MQSNSQTLAALGTACVDDGAAAARFHAHEKAVRTGAADFGRLVSTFHGHGDTFGNLLMLQEWPEGLVGSPRVCQLVADCGAALHFP